MKGVVFTEFLEMVEEVFSPDLVDEIIEACELPSGGAYTSLGTYEHAEMVQLVVELSKQTETPVADLLKSFGSHLFTRFVAGYPHFFEPDDDTFSFLSRLENGIHVEVKKLYPDAELPSFDHEASPGKLVMTYRSSRPFADLAEGLMRGCMAHFGEPIALQREDAGSTPTCSRVRFTLSRQS